jgi:hypothetical protein
MNPLERALQDPEFHFQMLDGDLNCLINEKTGCVVFCHPVKALSPHNMARLLFYLEELPLAKGFLEAIKPA